MTTRLGRARHPQRPLRGAPPLAWLCAALLCCLLATAARPARAAVFISTDTTINYAINDGVFVSGSPTVALVPGGSIAGYLVVFRSSAVLNVYGTGLSLSEPLTDEGGRTYYVLTSTLADGTPINNRVYLFDGAQLSQVKLHEVNPFDVLRGKVEALVTAGTLTQTQAHPLLVKLDAAQTALAAGDLQGVRDALGAFVNQVKAFVRTGKLSAAQGPPSCLKRTRPSSAAVNRQAVARAFCEANNGSAPAGYFVIGDGPTVGPKQ